MWPQKAGTHVASGWCKGGIRSAAGLVVPSYAHAHDSRFHSRPTVPAVIMDKRNFCKKNHAKQSVDSKDEDAAGALDAGVAALASLAQGPPYFNIPFIHTFILNFIHEPHHFPPRHPCREPIISAPTTMKRGHSVRRARLLHRHPFTPPPPFVSPHALFHYTPRFNGLSWQPSLLVSMPG